jgi:hypothetical protein
MKSPNTKQATASNPLMVFHILPIPLVPFYSAKGVTSCSMTLSHPSQASSLVNSSSSPARLVDPFESVIMAAFAILLLESIPMTLHATFNPFFLAACNVYFTYVATLDISVFATESVRDFPSSHRSTCTAKRKGRTSTQHVVRTYVLVFTPLHLRFPTKNRHLQAQERQALQRLSLQAERHVFQRVPPRCNFCLRETAAFCAGDSPHKP